MQNLSSYLDSDVMKATKKIDLRAQVYAPIYPHALGAGNMLHVRIATTIVNLFNLFLSFTGTLSEPDEYGFVTVVTK